MNDTITLPRSVVEKALAAFEHLVRRHYWLGTDYDDRAKSLRAALEQPQVEQETVGEAGSMPGTDGFTMACFRASDVPVGTKLYTRPQTKREPLTEADFYNIASNYFAAEWAQKLAVMMLKDHGIGGEE